MANLDLKKLETLYDALSSAFTENVPSSKEMEEVISVLAEIIKSIDTRAQQGLVQVSQDTASALQTLNDNLQDSVKRIESKQSTDADKLQKKIATIQKQLSAIPDVKQLIEAEIERVEVNPVDQAQFTIEMIDGLRGESRIDAAAMKNIEENIDTSKLKLPEIAEIDARKIKGIEDLLPKHPPINAGGSGATFLHSMRDVDRDNVREPSDGQVLKYNVTVGKWRAEDESGGGSALTVEEVDGSPSVSDVSKIVVSNGTLTDEGSGVVSLTTGGGSGSGDVVTVDGANVDTTANFVNTGDVTFTLTDGGIGGPDDISADINNNAVTYAKIQNVSATNRILGRDSAGAGDIEEITPAALRTMINVEDGATADQSDAEIETAINNQLTGTVVGTSDTQTLTNKTIDLTNNTLTGTLAEFNAAVSDATLASQSDLHDAVTVTDSSEINFTLTGQDITASLVAGSIDETKLDTSVNASLDLADSALQSGDNISELTNDSGFITNSSTDTLTNKTIDGDSNTISNLDIGNEVDWAAATDVADRSAAPASGDKLLLFEAGVGLRKIDWDDLPSGGSGGDNISVDGSAVTDPDFVSTGDIDFVDTSNTITANINDEAVTEAKLDAMDTPSDGEILSWNNTAGRFEWVADQTGAGGSAIVLDLGDDGSNESTDLNEIAVTNDTNSIFTEPAANKLLIDVSANWPTADVANSLATDAVDAIGEIASSLKSGADTTLVTGTAGTNGNLAEWNADGDLVDSGSATSDFAAASHTHATSDITSGTFADARIAETNVTQHEAAIDHDALANFVANEHVDHSSVSITAGTGLTGGGDLTTTRTLNVSGLTTSELAAATLVTEAEGITNNDNDTTLPTSAAVKDYVDNNAGGSGGTYNVNNFFIDQSGGTSDTHGSLSGTINGANTTFTVSEGEYASGTLKVWLNGQLQTEGTSEDYTETTPGSGTFDFATAPVSGDEITVEYSKSDSGAIPYTKAITVESPSDSEDITLFYTDDAITVTQLNAVLNGSSTPSVTYTIRHNSDRSATGNEVVTSGSTTTSTSTGDEVTSFNDATIPAGSWVWLETTAQSGTVDAMNVTVEYTLD